MRRKFFAVAGCAVVLVTGVFTFARQGGQQTPPQAQGAPSQGAAAPSYVIYRHLFRHILLLNQQADQEEAGGHDGTAHRTLYKRLANLNDQQADVLNRIASECDSAVEQKNAQIRQLVEKARAAYPGGKIEKDQVPPPPPAALKGLQNERQGIIQASIERLHKSLGDEAFARFDRFVQQNVAPNIKPVTMDSLRPAGVRRQPGLPPAAGR
jgi:hypothetical protein